MLSYFSKEDMSLSEKFFSLNFVYLFFIILIGAVGFLALYSAANGNLDPWALKHLIRFNLGLCGLLVVAMIDIRLWFKFAYIIYALSLALLVVVEIKGQIGMGAQRWINIGFMNLQPSEIMKVAVVLALARFFHLTPIEDIKKTLFLVRPATIAVLPTALVLIQPDLGTALMILMVTAVIFFVVGVRYWIFGVAIGSAIASLPIIWHLLHDYQKKRVLTFLNPESDPLGSGYHIMQSKIALGSGGVSGKGFLQGTQSHLNFLPEKQTDFIFTLLLEEWGFIGGVSLIILFAIVIFYGMIIAVNMNNRFSKLLVFGLIVNFGLYVFINIAMVTGLIPVVGVPLPMISNGGSAMLSVLFGFGLIMSCFVHKNIRINSKL